MTTAQVIHAGIYAFFDGYTPAVDAAVETIEGVVAPVGVYAFFDGFTGAVDGAVAAVGIQPIWRRRRR